MGVPCVGLVVAVIVIASGVDSMQLIGSLPISCKSEMLSFLLLA